MGEYVVARPCKGASFFSFFWPNFLKILAFAARVLSCTLRCALGFPSHLAQNNEKRYSSFPRKRESSLRCKIHRNLFVIPVASATLRHGRVIFLLRQAFEPK